MLQGKCITNHIDVKTISKGYSKKLRLLSRGYYLHVTSTATNIKKSLCYYALTITCYRTI